MLTKALEYGGADVGVIVYKSTKEWIEKNCFVPEWLKLLHWGDLTGTNALAEGAGSVRDRTPAGVAGRRGAAGGGAVRRVHPTTGICRAAEAGAHPDHTRRRRQQLYPGRRAGAPATRWAERLRRQITEGAIIQAAGRARAGLRKADEPLDIHLWTDVPVPELGPVEPVLWSELEAGLDGLMLAAEGVLAEKYCRRRPGYSRGYSPPAGWKKRGGRRSPVFCI